MPVSGPALPALRDPVTRPAPYESVRDTAALVRSTMAIVLAGGRGTRLANLTDTRAKPAVSFGGAYRMIDFALSNCVNSGIRRVGVCTQYKAQSLIAHIQHAWNFLDRRIGEFIELMPAQQRVDSNWYRGTADAVFQNIDLLTREHPDYTLILAGDHVYKMDYRRMLADHAASDADVTVGCVEVPLSEASAFGVIEVDADDRVIRFDEKPEQPRPLPGTPGRALASMGIYAFDTEVLTRELQRDARAPGSNHDFGMDLIPHMVRAGARVRAHPLARSAVGADRQHPYWRDVGTVDAFWRANLELTREEPALDLHDPDWPILSAFRHMPPVRFVFQEGRCGQAINSLIASGCVVRGATVRCSVLSSNVLVDAHSVVEDSVILPNVQIGARSLIRRAVIDKNCRLPPDFVAGVDAEQDRRRFHVTPGGVTLVTPSML
jgi:glucose-1-phosphate adenylyltransferase